MRGSVGGEEDRKVRLPILQKVFEKFASNVATGENFIKTRKKASYELMHTE